jgi:hypothetical protein
MSVRTAMLNVLGAVLPVLGPTALDIRTQQLTIQVRQWASGEIGAPNPSGGPDYAIVSSLVIPQIYDIRQLKTQTVSGSGGEYEVGRVIVEGLIPADPANPGVGFFPTELAPPIVEGQEVVYVIAGTHNGEYGLEELRTFNPLSYDLILERRLTTPALVTPDVSAGEPE